MKLTLKIFPLDTESSDLGFPSIVPRQNGLLRKVGEQSQQTLRHLAAGQEIILGPGCRCTAVDGFPWDVCTWQMQTMMGFMRTRCWEFTWCEEICNLILPAPSTLFSLSARQAAQQLEDDDVEEKSAACWRSMGLNWEYPEKEDLESHEEGFFVSPKMLQQLEMFVRLETCHGLSWTPQGKYSLSCTDLILGLDCIDII